MAPAPQATGTTLLTGGLIIDGTGSTPQPGGLLIENGVIAAVLPAEARLSAERVIDVDGRVISPGFIDLHSHADFALQGSPGAVSQLHQGVTTLLTGNCGFSPFPMLDRDRLVAATSFLSPELDWSWTDLDGFARAHDRTGTAINIALQVGHNALRLAAMGEERRPPTAAELTRMQALLADAARQGAYGFSTGLIYAPGLYADSAEVDALVAEAGRHGLLYSTHIRDEDDRLIEAVREAIDAARRGGARLEISHLKATRPPNFGRVVDALELIQRARAEGVDLGCDVYPYDRSSTTLTTRLPGWAMDGGIPALVARLADAGRRAAVIAELTASQASLLPADRVVLASGPEAGHSLAVIAERRGVSVAEATVQVLAEEHGGVAVINHSMHADDVATVLRHPLAAVASDGWIMAGPQDPGWGRGRPHPRNFGTFARVLGHYRRDLGLIDLAEAVRKMTSLPARRLRMADRGVLRAGAAADVAVFDPDTVADRSGFDEPWQLSVGVSDVLVAGVPVLADGAPTGARPGRVLRRAPVNPPGTGRAAGARR